jgi:hypothetical protein
MITLLYNANWSHIGEEITFQRQFKNYVNAHLTARQMCSVICDKHCKKPHKIMLVFRGVTVVGGVVQLARSAESEGRLNGWKT